MVSEAEGWYGTVRQFSKSPSREITSRITAYLPPRHSIILCIRSFSCWSNPDKQMIAPFSGESSQHLEEAGGFVSLSTLLVGLLRRFLLFVSWENISWKPNTVYSLKSIFWLYPMGNFFLWSMTDNITLQRSTIISIALWLLCGSSK